MNTSKSYILIRYECKNYILAFIGFVVPIVPATVSDESIEVGVGVDDARVLSHGPAHVQRTRTRYPTTHESETRFLLRACPPMRRYRPESRRYRMQLTILHQ